MTLTVLCVVWTTGFSNTPEFSSTIQTGILLNKNLGKNILEIGLGSTGDTHILWRHIFDTGVTAELNPQWVKEFRLSERLDSRSVDYR